MYSIHRNSFYNRLNDLKKNSLRKRYGHSQSQESRDKIAASRSGKIPSPETKARLALASHISILNKKMHAV